MRIYPYLPRNSKTDNAACQVMQVPQRISDRVGPGISKYGGGNAMRTTIILLCIALALASSALSSAANDEEREFFDGIQSRNIGPFRGGRAMVAVGVRQDPHVFYMGATGGVWKTENAGASWQTVSDDDFGTAAVGAIAVAPSDPNIVVVGMGECTSDLAM